MIVLSGSNYILITCNKLLMRVLLFGGLNKDFYVWKRCQSSSEFYNIFYVCKYGNVFRITVW